jgi:hypothetical protein
VSPDPLEGMDRDILRPIIFLDALLRLQAMLGHHVKVELNDYGCFFGCGFEGELEIVETMPSSASAISAFIAGGGGFFLDPEDCQAYVADAGEEVWLEFHRPVGPVVAIQVFEESGLAAEEATPR